MRNTALFISLKVRPNMAAYDHVTIIGVGLIGGSIGMALRARGLATEIVGVGRRETSLKTAQAVGAVDRTTTDLITGVRQADLVIVCAPVHSIAQLVSKVAESCPTDCLITDAASTKANIIAQIEQGLVPASNGPYFVGSHPLAGDHRTGPQHARGDLFEGRVAVVTPTATTPAEVIEKASQFWRHLGASVMEMSPAEHDRVVAVTSHLPHLVAFALAGSTPESAGPLAARGWYDTTRIAAADPELWEQIFASNDQALLNALDNFEAMVSSLKRAILDNDKVTLVNLLQEAKRIRDALGS
jgi:prephenate dehydrogenase